MFSQFQSYIIAGLVVVLLTVGGAFWMYHKTSVADIATLHANAAKYELAIEQQDRTINQMIADAKRLADANRVHAESMKTAEDNFVVEWTTIDAIDFTARHNAEELERKINNEFQKSIDGLKNSSGGNAGGVPDRMPSK